MEERVKPCISAGGHLREEHCSGDRCFDSGNRTYRYSFDAQEGDLWTVNDQLFENLLLTLQKV